MVTKNNIIALWFLGVIFCIVTLSFMWNMKWNKAISWNKDRFSGSEMVLFLDEIKKSGIYYCPNDIDIHKEYDLMNISDRFVLQGLQESRWCE